MMNRFITAEGVDGAGKSTFLEWLCGLFRDNGHTVVQTREPGGTPLAEKIRALLLSDPTNVEVEALLFCAGRLDHLGSVIKPALDRGEWVISDRFDTSSIAYQVGGGGLAMERYQVLNQWIGGVRPDTTFIFDLPTSAAASRINQVRNLDRFERQTEDFRSRVREAYLRVAMENPDRYIVVNANQPIRQIREDLESILFERFGLQTTKVKS